MEALQSKVLEIPGVTKAWVKANFGDLRFKATWQAALDRLSEVASATAEVLTSDRAKAVYTAILFVAIVLVVGLSRAAVYHWRTWVKPGAIALWRWVGCEFQHWLALAMLAQYE